MVETTRWAVVTGASAGLGLELARQLAERGYGLLIAARSEEKLAQIGSELSARYSVPALHEVVDLSHPDGPQRLFDRALALETFPEILVNNAGSGMYGDFVEQDYAALRSMIQLDLVAVTELSHLFAKKMKTAAGGRMMLVASMAAYQPIPLLAVYAAAKAYVLSLGEALAAELAPDVRVTVLSPGLMDTDFNSASGYVMPASLKRMVLAPTAVARVGLDAMFADRTGVIAGRLNKLMAFSSRFLSRGFSARASLRVERREADRRVKEGAPRERGGGP